MEIIFKVTIPDEDVSTVTDKALGPGGDLPEWLADFFEWNDRDYLTDLGLGQMAVEIMDVR